MSVIDTAVVGASSSKELAALGPAIMLTDSSAYLFFWLNVACTNLVASALAKEDADEAFNAATCIGCGACVATCKNASAMLFVSAKVSQFALLPQGQPERKRRVTRMVEQMDKEGFGNCTNTGACAVECPKGIDLTNIARMNRDFLNASVTGE